MLSFGLPEVVLYSATFQNIMFPEIVCSRFCKWWDDGILYTLLYALNADVSYENLRIDSAFIRVISMVLVQKRSFEQ